MKNYLAYLEKLQQEMIIGSEVDYDKVSEWFDNLFETLVKIERNDIC